MPILRRVCLTLAASQEKFNKNIYIYSFCDSQSLELRTSRDFLSKCLGNRCRRLPMDTAISNPFQANCCLVSYWPRWHAWVVDWGWFSIVFPAPTMLFVWRSIRWGSSQGLVFVDTTRLTDVGFLELHPNKKANDMWGDLNHLNHPISLSERKSDNERERESRSGGFEATYGVYSGYLIHMHGLVTCQCFSPRQSPPTWLFEEDGPLLLDPSLRVRAICLVFSRDLEESLENPSELFLILEPWLETLNICNFTRHQRQCLAPLKEGKGTWDDCRNPLSFPKCLPHFLGASRSLSVPSSFPMQCSNCWSSASPTSPPAKQKQDLPS